MNYLRDKKENIRIFTQMTQDKIEDRKSRWKGQEQGND